MSVQRSADRDAEITLLLNADPLWWLRDPAVPRHLCSAVAYLGEAPRVGAERVLRALTEALTREHVDFADEIVPYLGPSWPGREVFRQWFVAAPRPSATAVRILGALFPGADEVRSLLSADSPELRGAALRTLDSEPVVREAAVSDPSASVRRQALEALVDGWPDEPRTWEFLSERVELETGMEPRLFALRALGAERGLPDDWGAEPVWEDLASALGDRWLGPVAVHALVARHPDDPATLSTLIELAAPTNVHNDTRAAAVDVLGTRWPYEPGIRALVTDRAVADPDHVVRHTALARAALSWLDDETRRLLLDRAAHDRHADVRTLAAQILAALGDTRFTRAARP